MTSASAFLENISRGEKPRCCANQNASPIKTAVMTMFGQAFNAHWPDQVS